MWNDDDDDDDTSSSTLDESIEYLAYLIKRRLLRRPDHAASAAAASASTATSHDLDDVVNDDDDDDEDDDSHARADHRALAHGRFVDLTTTVEGERILEDLFRVDENDDDICNERNDAIGEGMVDSTSPSKTRSSSTTQKAKTTIKGANVVRLSIMALQSLLIYGMQIGVKGSDEMQLRAVRHLYRVDDDHRASAFPSSSSSYHRGWDDAWDAECVRRLKFRRDSSLGKMVLGTMKRKRTSRGAFDLLVELGVWDRHEDTSLLRSGFPVRFADDEIRASMDAESTTAGKDPDALLGIRMDLRHFKVFTIDGESTADIDDGISVEVLDDDDDDDDEGGRGATTRYRYWIHIADVDRWAPRGSALLGVAERRGTSLYLPAMTLCMFPEK